MAIEAEKLDFLDSVRFVLTVVFPSVFKGTLAPSRLWLPLMVRLNAGQWSAATIDAFRRKYKCDRFWVRFVFRRTLLVLDGKGMSAVLNSDCNQADPLLKKISLNKFIPDSILISEGASWRIRREFNEAVLDSSRCRHHHADAFIDIIFKQVDNLSRDRPERRFDWQDFRLLARQISQQVLLGENRFEPELSTELDHLVARANWFFLPVWILHPGYLASFYRKIRRGLQGDNGARSLMRESAERYAEDPDDAKIRIDNQVAFWVFVIRDALELHVTRTLALIAAHPGIQRRIREELGGVRDRDELGKQGRLDYLECCVREQLRLWTPIPILLRRATNPFRLPGDSADLQKCQQLMLYPAYYHRDPAVFGHLAHRFCPEHVTGRLPPTYYFSDGRQRCAGQNLALLLIKFTLAALLAEYRFELVGPQLDVEGIPSLYDHFHVRFRAIKESVSANRSADCDAAGAGAAPVCHA